MKVWAYRDAELWAEDFGLQDSGGFGVKYLGSKD